MFESDVDLTNFSTYGESGYTITRLSNYTSIEDPGAGSDGRLVFRTFTNQRPGATLTNDNGDLFDVLSLDVDDYVTGSNPPRGFFIDASSGASHRFTGTGPVDFSSLGGDWTNLSSLTFRYEGVSSTEVLSIDNIQLVTSVPEPASGLGVALLTLAVFSRRRRR
ncbi:MAG: PEP-CTERM sorting domain-containing protein [Planctomycetota bacterium]